jgi:hypothetical protein
MIRKGDRVKFLNDATVGTVARIEGAVAHVSVEDGFDIPVLLADLVAVDTETERQAMRRMGVGDGTPVNTNTGREPRPVPSKKPQPQRHTPQYGRISLIDDSAAEEDEDDLPDLTAIRQNYLKRQSAADAPEPRPAPPTPSPVELTDYDIKLCFVPQDATRPEESAVLESYLVNDSSYRVFYTIARWSPGKSVTLLASGQLEEDSKEAVGTFRREELNRLGTLQIGLLLFKPTSYVPAPAEDFTLELAPMKFVRRGNYVENDFFDEPAVVFTLATDREEIRREQAAQKALVENPGRNLPESRKDSPKKPDAARPKYADEPQIVDLHAEEILASPADMEPGEIIRAQLARFEIALDLALGSHRPQRLVFIHGVGSGKLKREMQKLLAAKYPKLRYQDASFREYGYGAILVIIR